MDYTTKLTPPPQPGLLPHGRDWSRLGNGERSSAVPKARSGPSERAE